MRRNSRSRIPNIENAPVLFFVKPITRGIANKIEASYIDPKLYGLAIRFCSLDMSSEGRQYEDQLLQVPAIAFARASIVAPS